jgi:hypothetical protein
MFNNYKSINLLKYMKAIIKTPSLIKENTFQFKKKKFKLLKRIGFMRNSNLKMGIIKLFYRHYLLKKHLKLLARE